jgi:hypothetical protein
MGDSDFTRTGYHFSILYAIVIGNDRCRASSVKEGFATNLPQGISDKSGQWRISAGYSGPVFCGKIGPEGPFSFQNYQLSD